MEKLEGHNADDRARAIRILSAGGLVAVPTETVYGLAADARNEAAVRRIFSVKGRPLLDPLIVHCDSLETAKSYALFPDTAILLAETFWPGPLTLVLPRRSDCLIPKTVSAGLDTLAIRIPAHPVLRALLVDSKIPLAAPSANPFGYISPTRASHVIQSLGERIEAVLDGGPCEHGVESTILSIDGKNNIRLLRSGPIPIEHVSKATGHKVQTGSQANPAKPEAPGMLASHYRPRKGIELFPEKSWPGKCEEATATVTLSRPKERSTEKNIFWLSESGDPTEIAHNLFDLLRKLDSDSTFSRIRVEFPSSSEGIFGAVQDRLSRAAVSPRS